MQRLALGSVLLLSMATVVLTEVRAQEAAPHPSVVETAPPPPATVASWAAAFTVPAIAGAGIDAAGRTLSYGHLELAMTSGRLCPVVVSERVVGAFFVGTGKFAYTSTDPHEAASYRTNTKRASGYEVSPKGAIGDTVKEFLLMLSSGAEEIGAGAAWRDGTAPPDVREAFQKHRDRFANDRGWRWTQLMPQALVDPPARPIVIAEIVAGKDDLAWVLDPLRDGDETLAVLEKSDSDEACFKDRRYPETLSHQLIDRSRLDPERRRSLLTAVDLTLVNPDGLRAELEVRETFKALLPLRTIHLALWSEVWGMRAWGASGLCNPYELQSVALADGAALPFHHLNGDLVVELPRALAAGETATLVFRIAGDVLFRPANLSFWELGTASWLPTPHLSMQAFTYHAVVKVKKPFVPFSCGRTVRRWQEGELECAEFNEDKPIQIPVVLAGKYTTYSEERDGITVRVSSYVSADAKAKKKLANILFGLLQFYKVYVGDYPFSELNLIEIEDLGWGQAPAGVIFITREAFNPMEDYLSRLYSEGINARLAHELAHTWWGHVAMLGGGQHEWMSESIAEYVSAVGLSRVWKEQVLDKAFGDWRGTSSFVKEKATLFTANDLAGEMGPEDRVALLYGKGPLVLRALHQELGDQMFFTVIRSYLKSFPFQPASTKQFIALTSFVAKKDYGPWFDRYLFGTEWPK